MEDFLLDFNLEDNANNRKLLERNILFHKLYTELYEMTQIYSIYRFTEKSESPRKLIIEFEPVILQPPSRVMVTIDHNIEETLSEFSNINMNIGKSPNNFIGLADFWEPNWLKTIIEYYGTAEGLLDNLHREGRYVWHSLFDVDSPLTWTLRLMYHTTPNTVLRGCIRNKLRSVESVG